jgi:hypothetical protein
MNPYVTKANEPGKLYTYISSRATGAWDHQDDICMP